MKILVINPNSSEIMTHAISAQLSSFLSDRIEIDCVEIEGAPSAIRNARDKLSIIPSLTALLERRHASYDAFVVACFGDPGVPLLKQAFTKPVLGIAEAGFYMALSCSERFGVICASREAGPNYRAYARALGIDARYGGFASVDMEILDLFREPSRARERIVEAAVQLRKQGISAAVLGCAGMAPYAVEAAEESGIAIVEPSTAAVSLLLGRFRSALPNHSHLEHI